MAIVVLGCRPLAGHSSVFNRRVERAAQAFHDGLAPWILASGGGRWEGGSEAAEMRRRLLACGVPAERLLTEHRSLNTRENARYSAELLHQLKIDRIWVVTSDYQVCRAVGAFRALGFDARGLAASSPPVTTMRQIRRALTEQVGRWLAGLDCQACRLERMRRKVGA